MFTCYQKVMGCFLKYGWYALVFHSGSEKQDEFMAFLAIQTV